MKNFLIKLFVSCILTITVLSLCSCDFKKAENALLDYIDSNATCEYQVEVLCNNNDDIVNFENRLIFFGATINSKNESNTYEVTLPYYLDDLNFFEVISSDESVSLVDENNNVILNSTNITSSKWNKVSADLVLLEDYAIQLEKDIFGAKTYLKTDTAQYEVSCWFPEDKQNTLSIIPIKEDELILAKSALLRYIMNVNFKTFQDEININVTLH